MIIRPRLHWLGMLFVWRGSVLRRILPQLLVVGAFAALVTWTKGHIGPWKATLTLTPFSLLSVALAIFLGFRNSSSYERFWEARKLWGALLNDCRSLARQVMTLTDATAAERQRLIRLLIAFTYALRLQLREASDPVLLQGWLSPEAGSRVASARYKPAVILVLFSEELAQLRRAGKVEPILAAAFEPPLSGLSHVLGGCERIATTPIPFTYSVIIHRVVYLYCFLLPFGLVDSIGVLMPLVVVFVAYAFFAVEALGDELQQPFGLMPNNLALDAISRTVEITLREMLGETNLPEPLKPDQNYRLS